MRIAVLEDDSALAEQLLAALAPAGHSAEWFANGKSLLARLKRDTFDLMILDWNVPDMTGIDVLKWARAHLEGPLPVLFVTSRSEESDIVEALDLGADDYVVKPIQPSELLARVGALLRRSFPMLAKEVESFGAYLFTRSTTSATIAGEPVPLTSKEFELALLLFRNKDRALSRSYLMDAVWGHDPDILTRTLDVHVSRIREKLRLRPAFGYRLSPVYSYGYRLEQVDPALEDAL